MRSRTRQLLAMAAWVCLAAVAGSRATFAGEPSSPATFSLKSASEQLSAQTRSSPPGAQPVGVQSAGVPFPSSAGPLGEKAGQEQARAGWMAEPGGPKPIPLAPPGHNPRGLTGGSRHGGQQGGTGRWRTASSLVTVASSLALVIGLFLLFAWTMRRTVPGTAAVLPSEVLEVLGRAALAGRAQVHLVRCGSKLLLVSISPTGVETLAEISDPDEVTRLAGLCRQARPESATAAFRQVLQQLAGPRADVEPAAARGDGVGLGRAAATRTSHGGLRDYGV